MRLKIYILLCWLLPAVTLYAGDVPPLRRLNEKTWRDLTEGKNYRDEPVRKKEPQEGPEKDRDMKWYPIDKPDPFREDNFYNTPLFKVLSYLIPGLLMLGLILWLTLKYRNQPNVKVNKGEWGFSLEDLEEHLEKTDLENYIKQATESGNFRLAIRLYYLNVLKELSSRGFIQWKKDKTNKQYDIEMSGHELSRDFHRLTIFFEKVWYGDALPDQILINDYRHLHDRFLQKIGPEVKVEK